MKKMLAMLLTGAMVFSLAAWRKQFTRECAGAKQQFIGRECGG